MVREIIANRECRPTGQAHLRVPRRKGGSATGPGECPSKGMADLTLERHPPQSKACLPLQRGSSAQSLVCGFTLLELLVVLLLVGLLTALVFPSIGRGVGTLRLKTSSREIVATLRLAHSKSITEQKIYWVSFDLEKNQVELSSDDRRYQKSFQLPEGIAISKVSSDGANEPRNQHSYHYFFEPNGMAQAFEVLLRNSRGRGMKIFQDPLKRSPRLEEVASESSGITVIR